MGFGEVLDLAKDLDAKQDANLKKVAAFRDNVPKSARDPVLDILEYARRKTGIDFEIYSDGQDADVVEVSAFAPPIASADEEVLVQIYLHKCEQASVVEGLARTADDRTARRSITTLAVEVVHGQRVDVVLEAADLTIDQPAQFVVWRGKPAACQFQLKFPPDAAGRNYLVSVRVFINSIPIGKLAFKLRAESLDAASRRPPRYLGESARRYQHAFLSYASPDRAEVLKRAQALKALHINFFQDLLSIDPGAVFKPQLFNEIDRCDLFLLFWSSHAAVSEWVLREAEYAVERRRKSAPDDVPDITPIILEGPPVPAPPDSLKHIHFNDWLRYVIAAVEAEQRP
jgi:hypothetical protein